jgi:hypothetical protein
MCSGTIYWSNIGTVVFASTEEKLLELTGDNSENMTLSLACREVFSRGQKDVRVFGPFEEVEGEVGFPCSVFPEDGCWIWGEEGGDCGLDCGLGGDLFRGDGMSRYRYFEEGCLIF